MLTIGTLVILVLLGWGYHRGHLSFGSTLVGLLAGLVFASTSVGAPIATAVKTSASSVGQSFQAAVNAAVKS